MLKRDVTVIGCSAGGFEALQILVAGLPIDLPAAVFIVIHIYPHSTSRLPEILQGISRLPVQHAIDGLAIRPGRVYLGQDDGGSLLTDEPRGDDIGVRMPRW